MITYVFPGQGSQAKGMGANLFDEFSELTKQADDVLGYSIRELCIEDPSSYLGQTQYTQPALYTVNALSYLKKVKESGEKPDFVAGHSLGEYNALFASGAFDFITGLKLVKKRGELMGRALNGGMAAVIGFNEEKIADVLVQNGLTDIDIANLNSPSQIVISGPLNEIAHAKVVFEGLRETRMFIELKTSGAFHSRYMKNSQKEFEEFLKDIEFSEIKIPVISNVNARQYKQTQIKQNLISQITNPVRWTESIRYLMGKGNMVFEEIGQGRVLTGLIQRIKKEAEPLIVDEIEEIEVQMESERAVEEEIRNIENDDLFRMDNESTEENDIQNNVIHNNVNKEEFRRITLKIMPETLGSETFKKNYNLKYAYIAGGMYRGIASEKMIVAMGKAGMMGFFGTGGLEISRVEEAIRYIKKELSEGETFGMNFLHNPSEPEMEEKLIDLFLANGVICIEAAAFLAITPAIVKYHAKGLVRDRDGNIITLNKIIAKVSRPEIAEAFLSPAPEWIISKLLEQRKITQEEAELSRIVPIADDLCAEADSGGHTDGQSAYALIPTIIRLRDYMMKKFSYSRKIHVGAAGGIGTPEAAAAAFTLNADFILTGSINQCTIEAATSSSVKDLLQQANVQDTEYCPAGDMFELGAKVQVLKKGLFFPMRANKLYNLYRQFNSIDEIDEKIKKQIQEKYFKRSFAEVYEEVKNYYPASEIQKAERNSKHKMALIFRWYFSYGTRLALSGNQESRVDYQIPCGQSLGAFNQWVKSSSLENWEKRHVDEIAITLLEGTAEILNQTYNKLLRACN